MPALFIIYQQNIRMLITLLTIVDILLIAAISLVVGNIVYLRVANSGLVPQQP